jgi:hypothetical protein
VAAKIGLTFQHRNGRSPDYYFPEIYGAGVGLLDYDNDGDLDVYLVQGGWPGQAAERLAGAPPTDRLYRNDLTIETSSGPQLRFVDVTEKGGVLGLGYGMGVAAGDVDNDGDIDLYLTNFGPNQLLRNDGSGAFADATTQSAADDQRWSTSATLFDYDRDGWLDLHVGNYVHFSLEANVHCYGPAGTRDYCGPLAFQPQPDSLFRNRGAGTFEDASGSSALLATFGAALGTVSADFDNDGWQDLYVANDQAPNQLWINQRDGTFRDEALLAGVSVNGAGQPEASMGVDAGDADNDGDEEIFLTHLRLETHTFYANEGTGVFSDRSRVSGLAAPSLPFTGFGTAWFDFDNDGWLDLLTVNGDVMGLEKLLLAGDPDPYRQTNLLFQNLDGQHFREVSAWGGPGIAASEASRGAAFGDLDNDGDTDVVFQNNGGPVRLLLNQIGYRQSWIGFRLVDPALHRDALGARLTLVTASGRTLRRRAHTDGSYLSSNDPRVLVGLGGEEDIRQVSVLWPDGTAEQFGPQRSRRYHTLLKGTSLGSVEPIKSKPESGPVRP